MSDIGGFTSAPIKLAAIINNRRKRENSSSCNDCESIICIRLTTTSSTAGNMKKTTLIKSKQNRSNKYIGKNQNSILRNHPTLNLCSTINLLLLLITILLISPSLNVANLISSGSNNNKLDIMRHKTHYMNINPSTHFQYNEGRQLSSISSSLNNQRDIQERSLSSSSTGGRREEVENQQHQQQHQQQVDPQQHFASHIYKRSSALLSSSHYPPLVSHSIQGSLINPLSRRMMSETAHSRWTSPQMIINNEQQNNQQQYYHNQQQQQQHQSAGDDLVGDLISSSSNNAPSNAADTELSSSSGYSILSTTGLPTHQKLKKREHEEAELLRQKQHIQYHDQWPSLAGKCHKRTLNFCASVLPFNTTTFPNIIGDTNRFEVKRSLPFFGFLAKSSCNKRLDELLCLLLEPPCNVQSGIAIPPCKKFCRLALEGCNEYIPATLAMSSVFDCRQYPDSNDPNVCINLAQGSKCAADEFKCPDKTCIPRNWLCDGVRDCIFAADEANCTEITGAGLQTSVCSTEEFKCDGKCVPKAWKCDGERDCLDGSDEESCDQRPRCGPDRFKCADGNGCLPKRWVCDGKAECRDGSDEMNCEQQECSENDFKCDNGICIPKIWKCDRQFDCKDGSDEKSCVYPTTTSTTTTLNPITTPAIATESPNYVNSSWPSTATSKQTNDDPTQQVVPTSQTINLALPSLSAGLDIPMNYYGGNNDNNDSLQQQQQQQQEQQPQLQQQIAKQQLESSLNEDISRIIQLQQEAPLSAPSSQSPISVATYSDISSSESQQHSASTIPVTDISQLSIKQQNGVNSQKELKKFDYDIIQSSSSPNLMHLNDLSGEINSNQQHQQQQQQQQMLQQAQKPTQQMQTQIDFVPQQQQHHQQQQQQQSSSARQVTPASHLLVANTEQLISQQQQQHQNKQVFSRQQFHRDRSNGQVIQASPPSTNGQKLAGDQDGVVVGRVPIYRSLFKTLKGGQGRLHAATEATNQHGNRYSISRRRRERHQQNANNQQIQSSTTSTTVGKNPEIQRINQQQQQIWTSVAPSMISSSSAFPILPETSSSPTLTAAAIPQVVNSTHQQNVPQSLHRTHHGVASYLQLLNSRYNLRLNRVSSQPTMMVA